MARRKSAAQEVPYHHGALREALLEATESLLNESGLEGFTLRECARRAGVSHGAPAHHFADVRGLLTEFTAQSFEQMAALMQRYMDAAQPGAYERLVANGLAYVDYALTHRGRFQLMFRSDRLDFGNERLRAAAHLAHGHLEACMRAVLESTGRSSARLDEFTTLAWSMAHGLSTLMLDNKLFSDGVGDTEVARQRFLGLMRMTRPVFEGRDGE